ncbi:MAG: sugar kinase [Halovenus sp.]
MTELITFGETPLRFSPQGHQRLERADEMTIHADGTESNVAVAAQELGAEALWLSKLPESPLGRRVVTQIEEQGIETDIAWTDDGSLRQGFVFRESGSKPRQTREHHDRQYTAAATAQPVDFPMDRVQDASVVFTGLSTPVLSPETAETTRAILRASGGSGAVTAMDLDYSPALASPTRYRETLEELAEDIDMLIANVSNVNTVLDRDGGPRELANLLAADYDLEVAVITRSEKGAVALHDSPGTNVIHERETIPTETVDPTGTHGAFAGAFLQQLIDGANTARSLTYAVAVAALSRTIPGPFLTTIGDEEIEPLVDEVNDRSP